MKDLSVLGFEVSETKGPRPDERRAEVRIVETKHFVAWFQTSMRMSDGERVVGTSTQFIRRKELSEEQIIAVREWLSLQVLSASFA